MDKQTLSNYGWLVIVTLILAVMLALATPFGTYVGDAVVSIANGYVNASNNAMDDDNIKANSEKFDNKFDYGAWEAPIYGTNSPKLNHSGTIPAGGTYRTYNGIEYTAGQAFPELGWGDVYYYEDYEYHYQEKWCIDCGEWSDVCGDGGEADGWCVKIIDSTKTQYGDILESIAGAVLVSARGTFYNCNNLVVAPIIPNSVTDMRGTFAYCTSLITAPELPSNVVTLWETFMDCESLTTPPSVIPESAKDLDWMFYNCYSLTGTIEINCDPTYTELTFEGTSLPIKLTGSGDCVSQFVNEYSNITIG